MVTWPSPQWMSAVYASMPSGPPGSVNVATTAGVATPTVALKFCAVTTTAGSAMLATLVTAAAGPARSWATMVLIV